MIQNVKAFIASQFYNYFVIGVGLGMFIVGVAYSGGIFIILGAFAFCIGCLAVSIQDSPEEKGGTK